MNKSIFSGRAKTNLETPEVEEHTEKRQRGFIVILLMLAIVLFVLTPVGCSTLLALLAGTGAAVAP
jgi:flagellar basal body-associated protein FliL